MLKVQEKIQRGCCLIASPWVPMDPHFQRTVILITDHEDDLGTSGIVLNRSFPEDLQREMSETICGKVMQSHFLSGGPVGLDQAFCLIDSSVAGIRSEMIPKGEELFEGVFQPLIFDDVLDGLSKNSLPEDRAHFFRGFAGWESGQLQSELNEQVWINVKGQGVSLLSGDREKLWGRMLCELSEPEYRVWSQWPLESRVN